MLEEMIKAAGPSPMSIVSPRLNILGKQKARKMFNLQMGNPELISGSSKHAAFPSKVKAGQRVVSIITGGGFKK